MNNENVYNCIIAKWSHEEEGEITTGGPRPRERCSAKSMQDHNRISQNKEAQTRRSGKRSPKRAIKKTRSQSNTRYHSTVHRLLYLQTVLFFSSLQSLLFVVYSPSASFKGVGEKNSLKAGPKYGNYWCFRPTVDTVTSPFQLPWMFPRSRFLPAGATNLNKSKSPDNVYYTPTYSVPITVFVRGNAQSIHGVRCVEGNKAQNTVQHWNSVFCCFLVFWNTLYTTKITTQRKQANRILLPVSVLVTKSTAQQSLSAGVCVCVCVLGGNNTYACPQANHDYINPSCVYCDWSHVPFANAPVRSFTAAINGVN